MVGLVEWILNLTRLSEIGIMGLREFIKVIIRDDLL